MSTDGSIYVSAIVNITGFYARTLRLWISSEARISTSLLFGAHRTNGMPRSLQIFRTRLSRISVCRGTDERLFCDGISPPRMIAALANEDASLFAQVLQDLRPFHTVTSSSV